MGCNKSKHATVASGNTMKMSQRRPVTRVSVKSGSVKRSDSKSSRTAPVVMAEVANSGLMENVVESKAPVEDRKRENLDVHKELGEGKKIDNVGEETKAENANEKKGPEEVIEKVDSQNEELSVEKMDNVDVVGIKVGVSPAETIALEVGVVESEKGDEKVEGGEPSEANSGGIVVDLVGELTAESVEANEAEEDTASKEDEVTPEIVEDKCDVVSEEQVAEKGEDLLLTEDAVVAEVADEEAVSVEANAAVEAKIAALIENGAEKCEVGIVEADITDNNQASNTIEAMDDDNGDVLEAEESNVADTHQEPAETAKAIDVIVEETAVDINMVENIDYNNGCTKEAELEANMADQNSQSATEVVEKTDASVAETSLSAGSAEEKQLTLSENNVAETNEEAVVAEPKLIEDKAAEAAEAAQPDISDGVVVE